MRMTRLATLRHRLAQALVRGRHDVEDANFIGFDKYRKSGSYHWRELNRNPFYRQKAEFLGRLVHTESVILDLGCGDAAFVYFLSSRCHEVVGVDADYDAIRLANRELSRRRVVNALCIQRPLSDLARDPEFAGRFDLVYSMDVIEHLPRPEELLEVARTTAKPGGTVVVGTPLFLGESLKSPYHVREFAAPEIRLLLQEYLDVSSEEILPERRRDGQVYDESFFIGVGTPS